MQSARDALVLGGGLCCFIALSLNAALLIWLMFKSRTVGLSRCPRCGRPIACPHCADEQESVSPFE